MSNARPTTGPKKSGGVTPTIVDRRAIDGHLAPTMFAAPPKRVCHKHS